MPQVQDIVNNALRFLGVLAVGETASSQELTDGLTVLNELVYSLSAEQIYLWGASQDSVSWPVLTASQTWGVGGNITTPRPLRLMTVTASYSGIVQPVEIISRAAYTHIADPAGTAFHPLKILADYGYPLTTLTVWPLPKNNVTLLIQSLKPMVNSFQAITDTFDMPPGYERAIRLNLALDLAPEYGVVITPAMSALAEQAKRALRVLNKQNIAGLDPEHAAPASENDAPPPAPAAPQGAA